MCRFYLIVIGAALCGLLAGTVRADTFQLNDGSTVTGTVIQGSANDGGVQIRVDEGKYQRVPWSDFSQADLKKLAQDSKLEGFVEPFIEVSAQERIQRTQVKINPVPRLDLGKRGSLLGAMFSSGLGVFVLFLLYAANFYAAYEVSIFRAQPIALVAGVSAVLPVIGPIVFLAMPVRLKRSQEDESADEPSLPAHSFAVPGGAETPAAATSAQTQVEVPASAPARASLRIAPAEGRRSTSSLPMTQVFQRGAFTFNRRFFETKFPGFFGVVKRDAEKDLVLVFRSVRGEYIGQRISRIAANDLHLHVQKGSASEEITIPFSEIQEVRLQHKDA